LLASVVVLTQLAPQAVRPDAEQVHVPAEQSCPLAQVTPHAPQLFGSVTGSQTPPQLTWLGHVQDPAVQTSPTAHASPHPPQFAASVCGLTHAVPHNVAPTPVQAQVPAVQICPTAHA
jgi:hypothetical protein